MTYTKRFQILLGWLLSLCFLISFSSVFVAQAIESPPEIASSYVILIDADSGIVLYEKNSQEQAFPASTTKIMTGLLVCEMAEDLKEEITVGREVNDFSAANSRIGEKEGENIRIIDLLYGMMLLSGNDAAATLAIHFGGSLEGFADLMNAKARELGLSNTHFVNPHGIHEDDHYTTAADLAKLSQAAMQNELFRKVVSTPSYTMPETNKHSETRTIYNTNKFISTKEDDLSYNWKPVTGIKTGHTNKAQACLVTSASQDNKNLICVLLHDSSADKMARWTESRELLEYGFRNLQTLNLSELPLKSFETLVNESSKKDEFNGLLALKIKADGISITGLASDLEEIKADPSLIESIPAIKTDIKAPVHKGDVCGTVTIKYNDSTIAVADLIADRDVASVEADPKNPVDSLIQSVVEPDSGVSPGAIALIVLFIVILILLIMLIIRHNKSKRSHSSRKRYTNSRGGRSSNRYKYNRR